MADPSLVPVFPPVPRVGDFLRGFLIPFGALRLVFRSRKLLVLSTVSAVVTLAALVLLVALLGQQTDDWLNRLWPMPASWLWRPVWYLTLAVTFVLLLVVGINTVPLLLISPLQDPLSEATEELCGGYTSPPFSVGRLAKSLWVAIAHTLARIAVLLLGHLVLLPLHLVPGLGSTAWSVLASGWTMYWMAGEYLSGPMARHLYGFADVRRILSARVGLCLGFGAAIWLLLWVPVVQLFFIPTAVVAGTLLYRGLLRSGSLEPPRTAGGPGA